MNAMIAPPMNPKNIPMITFIKNVIMPELKPRTIEPSGIEEAGTRLMAFLTPRIIPKIIPIIDPKFATLITPNFFTKYAVVVKNSPIISFFDHP